MKKKVFILFTLILFCISFQTMAYDFSAINNDGDTIYYKILSSTAPYKVAVTYKGSYSNTYNEYNNSISIPAHVINNYKSYTVTSIGESAFEYCNSLTSVTLPNSITSIGGYAFCNCSNLTNINLPNSITDIGEWAFGECISLTSANIPYSLTSINNSIFYDCVSLSIPVNIPNNITKIGEFAFWHCQNISSVYIPNSVTSIGMATFDSCLSLTSISIPNSVSSIGKWAFWYCKGLTSVNIPNSLDSINHAAFYNCSSLTSISIPNSVTYIGTYAFRGCTSLTNCILGNSLTNIDNYAFAYCNNLSFITSQSTTPPIISSTAFTQVPNNVNIHVPCSSLNLYQNASNWSNFTNYKGYLNPTLFTGEICQGETYTSNGFNESTEGLFIRYSQTANTCENATFLNLSVNQKKITNISAEICDGETYTLNGFNANSSGTHTLNLQSSKGCDSIVTLNLITNQTNTPYDLAIYNGTNYHIISWKGDGDSYIIYRDNDSLTTTSLIRYYDNNVVDGTNYNYKVKASINGCESEFSNEISSETNSLNDISNDGIQTNLFPNPTNNKSILKVEGLTKDADVIVYDINGRRIKQYKLNAGQGELEIDVNGLAKGIYNIKVVSENISTTKKLVVK